MKNVLITRNKERAREIVKIFSQHNFRSFIEPLFEIEKLEVEIDITKKISAIIVTSVNACETISNFEITKDILIFAVGRRTAKELQDFGFTNILISQDSSAQSLKELIIKTNFDKSGRVLYFHGSIVTLDFKEELRKEGFEVENILCYKTHEISYFSSELIDFSKNHHFDQVLLFSANSAQIFLKMAKKHNMLEYFRYAQIVCFSDKIFDQIKNSENGIWAKNSIIFSKVEILKNFYD